MTMRNILSACRAFLFTAVAAILCASLTAAAGAAPLQDTLAYQGAFPASTPNGLSSTTLTINGETRDLLIYRPAAAAPLPLLIFFSGTGATLEYNIADEMGRENLRAFADQQAVIVAIPIPRIMSRGDWDNHSSGTPYWETAVAEGTAGAASADPDRNPDLLLTRAIIQEATLRYGIDTSRVYLNGFSNGAFFSYFAAATLNDRIAAFAETGGGLVLSNTTAGTPSACTTKPFAGKDDEIRNCPDAGWSAGMCAAADAIPRPIAPSLQRRIPPAFMEANDNDDSVPFAHTCNLSAALPAATPRQTRITHSGNGHGMNDGYLLNSWNFMKGYRLQYQGLWWNPDESGWGLSLTQHDATIFAALYSYDQAGLPSWYVMSNCPLAANECSGDIYRVSGGISPAAPWNGSGKLVSKAGAGKFSFSDANHASLSFTIDGIAGTKNITQQWFGAVRAAPAIDYTDLWWNPDESGWGVALTQQYDIIFAAWYTYNAVGQAVWYVASNCAVSGNACSGDVYEASGGSMLTSIWNGSHKLVKQVGNVTFTFSDAGNGSMSYTLNGIGGSRSITRQGF